MSRDLQLSARSAATYALGSASALAGLALIATSAWLVSRAAQQPNIASLSLAIVGVRFFGISRGLLRYAERLVGHDAALRSLADLRLRVYRALARARGPAPRALRSGDLLVRLVDDVDSLLDLMLRVRQPFVVAGVVGACASAFLALLVPGAGLVLAGALLLSATAVPAVSVWQVRRSEARLAATRGLLSTAVVDLLDGAPDLIAYGAAADQLRRVEEIGAELTDAAAGGGAYGGDRLGPGRAGERRRVLAGAGAGDHRSVGGPACRPAARRRRAHRAGCPRPDGRAADGRGGVHPAPAEPRPGEGPVARGRGGGRTPAAGRRPDPEVRRARCPPGARTLRGRWPVGPRRRRPAPGPR